MTRSITRVNPVLLSGTALIALAIAGLSLHIPGSDSVGSDTRTAIFVTLLAVAAAIYLLAVRHVLRRPASPHAVLIVLAIAIAMRIPALLGPPFLSSDMYRYVWDGRVQVAGINPYRYLPADPALQSLRDDTVYPLINRKATAHTIYPPAAQIVFQAVARLSDSVLAMKLAMVGFEALACFAVLRLLALAHLPPERVLIYAWNPLAVWAFAGNGHVDAIAIGLLAVALLLRAVKRDAWVGLVFGAAVLVKFLPAAVAPALWRREAPWRMPLVAIVTIVALYLPVQQRRLAGARLPARLFRRRGPDAGHRHLAARRARPPGAADPAAGEGLCGRGADRPGVAGRLDRLPAARDGQRCAR